MSLITCKNLRGSDGLEVGVVSLVGTLTRVTRRILPAAAVATMLVTTANAATAIYWKGGSGTEAEPKDVYDKNNWTGSNTYSGNSISQDPTGQHNFHFKADSLTYLTNHSPSAVSGNICELMIFHAGDYSLCGFFKASGNFAVGYDEGDVSTVAVNGGGVTVGGTMDVGRGDNGTLTINNGSVTVATANTVSLAKAKNKTGTLNLNGGTLTTKKVHKGHNNGTGYLNFNGGTLKANSKDSEGLVKNGVGITVLAGGGTIDCNGMDIAIDSQWSTESTGGMNFTGGNGNTISIPNLRLIQYPGITSIAPGTRLAVSNWGASKDLIANGLVVAGVPTVGDTIFTCTRGDGYTLDGVSLDNVKCPVVPGTTFALDESKTNIVVTAVGTPLENYWTGAAQNGNLNDERNWSDHVPGSGENANILCAAPVTLTNGEGFTPDAITFLEGSAAVTIDGGDFTGIVAVTNLSSASHTFNAKVYFAGDIQVKQAAMADTADLAKPHVTFAGGAYAAAGCSLENNDSDAVYSRCVFGKYYLGSTAESPWSAMYDSGQKRVCVADGAELHVPYADNLTELYVGTGAHVFVGELAAAHDQRASYQDYGEMVVSNLVATGSGKSTRYFYMTHNQGTSNPAVFKFNSVTNDLSAGSGALFTFADNAAAGKHVFYIGEGGVNYKDSTTTIFVLGRDADGNSETIRPWYSDFTIGARPGGSAGLRMFRDVEFCTDDENGTGRTITLEARTQVQANKTAAITVSGKGTLKVTQPADNGAQPTVTLTDTATLEYMTAAATLGTGTVTLGDSTTFAFVNSGNTLKLPAPIAIPDTGTATLRIDGTRLKGGVDHVLMDTAPDGWDASDPHLAITGTALDGRRYTLAEKDGSLVFNIAPTGLSIIIR